MAWVHHQSGLRCSHRSARGSQAVGEDFVGNHVQLLLVLTRDVLRASRTSQVRDACSVDHRGNLLAGNCNGRQHHCQLIVDPACLLLLQAKVQTSFALL